MFTIVQKLTISDSELEGVEFFRGILALLGPAEIGDTWGDFVMMIDNWHIINVAKTSSSKIYRVFWKYKCLNLNHFSPLSPSSTEDELVFQWTSENQNI